jgi:hypothetical protein
LVSSKKVGVGSARSIKSCIRPAVRQVVFAGVQITIRQRVAVPLVLGYWSELAPIGLHKTNAASDWLLIKQHCIAKKGLPGVQVTKLIGLHKLLALFWHLPERGCYISTKNQRCLQKIQKPAAALVKAKIIQFSSTFSKSIS